MRIVSSENYEFLAAVTCLMYEALINTFVGLTQSISKVSLILIILPFESCQQA